MQSSGAMRRHHSGWDSRRGNHLGQRSPSTAHNRPDIWMQASRSTNLPQNLASRGPSTYGLPRRFAPRNGAGRGFALRARSAGRRGPGGAHVQHDDERGDGPRTRGGLAGARDLAEAHKSRVGCDVPCWGSLRPARPSACWGTPGDVHYDDDDQPRPGGGGSDGVQLHSGPAFYYNDLYFSMLQVMDSGGTGNMPIELALSRDGYSWKRPFRNIWFIPPLENKNLFDASLIWSNATPVYSRDMFRFYYGAYGKPWNSSDNRQISGIGFAEMPRNRFAGIRPLKKFGQITLKSLALDKIKRIEVNGHAANGSIRVEVLGDYGYRIKGFTKADSIPIKTDSLRNISEWNNESISQLPKGRYRLRIHLENAEVYAVTLIN